MKAKIKAVLFLTAAVTAITVFVIWLASRRPPASAADAEIYISASVTGHPFIAGEYAETGKRSGLYAVVADGCPDEKALRLYGGCGIDAVSVGTEANIDEIAAHGFDVYVTAEDIADVKTVSEKTGKIAVTPDICDKETAEFIVNSGKSVLYAEKNEIWLDGKKGLKINCGDDIRKIFEAISFAEDDGFQAVLFENCEKIKNNEKAVADLIASFFNPAKRKKTASLNIGIPDKRSFSATASSIWLTGGADPENPLYLADKKTAMTANGLFSAKLTVGLGGEFLLKNGENKAVFNITATKTKSTSTTNAKSENVGKTATVKEDGCYRYYAEIPVKSNSRWYYAMPGTSDKIVAETTAKDYSSGDTLSLYKLESGLYIEKSAVTVGDGKKKAVKAENIGMSVEDGFLKIEAEAYGEALFYLDETEDAVRLTFVGITLGELPMMPENGSFEKTELSDGSIVFHCKNGTVPSGFYGEVKNGNITVWLRLEKRVKEGEKLSGITVMLDAGHSNNYGGTQGPDWPNDTKERDLNYKTASLVAEKLRTMGARVILSRDEESDGILYASKVRTWYRYVKADIGVSIHFNAVGMTADPLSRSGVLVICANLHGRRLAETLCDGICELAVRPKKGASTADYTICHTSYLPSVIIECGYLTNIFEYDWFLKDENVDCYASAVASSIYRYFAY